MSLHRGPVGETGGGGLILAGTLRDSCRGLEIVCLVMGAL